jgi:predicted regulator of Ras-like GTPase activity (Roadblock/LC7/MglB family)
MQRSDKMARSIVLPTQQLDEVEQHLSRLYDKTGATCALLIDISGQLISYKGTPEGVDLAGLAALAASDMAAVTEIARLVGERDQFKLLFHEGEKHNVLISTVGRSFLLVIIFKTSVRIGLVRLFARETVNTLLEVAEKLEATSGRPAQIVDADFTSSLASELERAFSDKIT